MQCPYCHSTVMLKDSSPPRVAASRPVAFRAVAPPPKLTGFRNRLRWVVAITGFAIVVILVLAGLFVRVADTALPNRATYVPPVFEDPHAPPALPPTPPPPPSFANQVMDFGSEGIGAGQFKDARSIGLDGAGHIYVGEYSVGRIQVFDADGKFLKTWTIDSKSCLSNLAVNRDGTLIAVMDGKILSFEGMTGRSFGEAASTTGDSQENYTDACYALTGDIFAIDTDSNIVVLDGTGQIKRTIKAKQNMGDDELDFDKIAVNGNGQIYVIDRKKGILQFGPDGRYINRFGRSDDDDPTDRRPDTLEVGFNLAIDGKGRIYVGDANPAIKVFDSSGRFLDSIGGDAVCFGLAITDQNQILGCFRNDYAVRKFALAKK
jgi:sugar lactone lactonase YvrE